MSKRKPILPKSKPLSLARVYLFSYYGKRFIPHANAKSKNEKIHLPYQDGAVGVPWMLRILWTHYTNLQIHL
jgi:hypothetical protein